MGCPQWPALLFELPHNTAHAAKRGFFPGSSRVWTDNLTLSSEPREGGVHRYGTRTNHTERLHYQALHVPLPKGKRNAKRACQYRWRLHLAGQ